MADCPREGLTPIGKLNTILSGDTPDEKDGERVQVRGVVTGDFRGEERLNGFFIQSESSDAPPQAIFVYAPSVDPDLDALYPGKAVVVAGQAGLFHGRPQISQVRQLLPCEAVGLPEPYPLSLPSKDRSGWKALEGVLVRPENTLTVTSNYQLGRFGSLSLSARGREFRHSNFRDNRPFSEGEASSQAYRIVLDDAHYRQNPEPVPYLDDEGTRRVGDELPPFKAILSYAFNEFRLHPLDIEGLSFDSANPRPEPPARQGPHRIAAFNVENYFLTLGERGADSHSELAAQQSALKAVAQGLDADILGLIEIENDPEAVDDLATRLSRAKAVELAHFKMDSPVGTDAIRTALFWREEAVELLGGPYIDDRRVHHRPIVAGHFRFGDEGPGKIVAMVHYKAKVGCPDEGDVDRGQGCWNERRTRQSQALLEFLAELQEESGSDRVLIMGDINSYGGEDPVVTLIEGGLQDLVAEKLSPDARYNYVFRGESGYLNTAIASTELAEDVSQLHFWHINADEPVFLQFQQDGPWRSSDHDPVIVDLK